MPKVRAPKVYGPASKSQTRKVVKSVHPKALRTNTKAGARKK